MYLINHAQELDYTCTQFSIVKSIFVADLRHLEKFGRPVTFDNFAAMQNGPVASCTYNLIRPDGNHSFAGFDTDEALWETVARPDLSPTTYVYRNVKRPPNLKELSKTDCEELHQAVELVNKLGFFRTRDFTHEHRAYKNAWKDGSAQKSFPMDYRLMMPSDSDEDYYELVEASKHV